jgi:hypothetical protein
MSAGDQGTASAPLSQAQVLSELDFLAGTFLGQLRSVIEAPPAAPVHVPLAAPARAALSTAASSAV